MKKISFIFFLSLTFFSCEKKVVDLPVLSLNPATNITETSAALTIDISNDGGEAVTEFGLFFGENYNPETSGTKALFAAGEASRTIINLMPNTTYYVKGFATNSVGTTYTNQIQFTTLARPTLITNEAVLITHISAILGGEIISAGSAIITERGIYWGLSPKPETTGTKLQIETTENPFSNTITEFLSSTTYYYKAYAINNVGESLGEEMSFTTKAQPTYETGTVTDSDGNIYNTVKIGEQWWMAENLKTTKYNDGTDIPYVTDNTTWRNIDTPAFCYFENDEASYKETYGNLYNWYAVNTDKLGPLGWHVPSDSEWTQLINFLGGENVAGGKMKEIGLEHWGNPNTGATNESGFTALPAGYRIYDGAFYDYYQVLGFWWTSTQYDSYFSSYARSIAWDNPGVLRYTYYKKYGFSVRCIKD